MKGSLCLPLSLLLLLPPVYYGIKSSLSQDEFKTYDMMMNWKDAQSFCRNHHVDLLTIRRGSTKIEYSEAYGWFGLHRENEVSRWKWSDDERATIINQTFESQADQHCAFKKKGEVLWQSDNCLAHHPFSCYNPKLVLVKQNKTWEEALDHCRSLAGADTEDPTSSYRNHTYDLVTLTTEGDHSRALRRVERASTAEVWTGLRFLAGEWWWVGGEPMQYDHLQSCPILGSCGVLQKNGTARFNVRDCGERRNFLCYKKRKIRSGMEVPTIEN